MAAAVSLLAELAAGEGAAPEFDEAAVRRFLDDPGNGLLMAHDGVEVVGILSYAVLPSFFREAMWAQIGHVVVRGDRRRQGIGAALLDQACRRFERMGLREALVSALPGDRAALELYRRFGFEDRSIGLERRFGEAAGEAGGVRGGHEEDLGQGEAQQLEPGHVPAGMAGEKIEAMPQPAMSLATVRESTSPARVRPATAGDAAAVAGLIREMADEWEEPSPVTPEWVAEFLGDDACFAVVAELDGDVVGVVTWVLERGLFHAKKSAVVAEASVTRAHRDKGIGRAMLEEALVRIKRQDVAEISIGTGFENERAKHLYRSLGFTEETLLLEQHLEQG